jgi:uncharacterized protein
MEMQMKIIVSGASGLVGTMLIPSLQAKGHEVIPMRRTPAKAGEICWDPDNGQLDAAALEGADAVIHLGGENIASGRWDAAKKARIRESRVKSTTLLSEALASLKTPPSVFLCASAVGYYGDRSDEWLTENSAPGQGFLPEVCQAWEASTKPASDAGIRVVNLRFGMILSPEGGALAKMVPPFRLGAGGPIGSGGQYMSWIVLEDVVGVIHHALETESLRGPVNVVSPEPVKNRPFSCALGRALDRPAIAILPGFMARLMFGEMADALLLSSERVKPAKLLETGYSFQYPEIQTALNHLFE